MYHIECRISVLSDVMYRKLYKYKVGRLQPVQAVCIKQSLPIYQCALSGFGNIHAAF